MSEYKGDLPAPIDFVMTLIKGRDSLYTAKTTQVWADQIRKTGDLPLWKSLAMVTWRPEDRGMANEIFDIAILEHGNAKRLGRLYEQAFLDTLDIGTVDGVNQRGGYPRISLIGKKGN